MKKYFLSAGVMLTGLMILGLLPGVAKAVDPTVIKNLNAATDGKSIQQPLFSALDGNYYGVASDGGGGGGTLFSINKNDYTYTVLASFGVVGGPASPSGMPIKVNNSLFGLSKAGGEGGRGTIYRYDLGNGPGGSGGGAPKVLKSFYDGLDPDPRGALLYTGGKFYGIDWFGLFSFQIDGNGDITKDPNGNPIIVYGGGGPSLGGPVITGGYLYHSSGNSIVASSLNLATSTTVFTFSSQDNSTGMYPGPLHEDGGYLYGVSSAGIFRIKPKGKDAVAEFKMLHNFGGIEGTQQNFSGPPMVTDGRVYVAMNYGAAHGYGSLVSAAADGSHDMKYYSLPPGNGPLYPSSMPNVGGEIISSSYNGGTGDGGTIFTLPVSALTSTGGESGAIMVTKTATGVPAGPSNASATVTFKLYGPTSLAAPMPSPGNLGPLKMSFPVVVARNADSIVTTLTGVTMLTGLDPGYYVVLEDADPDWAPSLSSCAVVTVNVGGIASCAVGNAYTGSGNPGTGNPVPTITSINPSTKPAGSPALDGTSGNSKMTVTGTNFLPAVGGALGSTVFMGSVLLPTNSIEYVSATELKVTVPVAQMAVAGTFQVSVVNPAPGGGSSPTTKSFIVTDSTSGGGGSGTTNPAPTLTSINPSSKPVGTATDQVITLVGTNFNANSEVHFDGVELDSTFISSTQMTAIVPVIEMSVGGVFDVDVTNPPVNGIGGGTSLPKQFTVTSVGAPGTLQLDIISPDTRMAGSLGSFTMVLDGQGFAQNAKVNIGSFAPITPDVQTATATRLIVDVPFAVVANPGNFNVSVTNPGQGTSNTLPFVVIPDPGNGNGGTGTIAVNKTALGGYPATFKFHVSYFEDLSSAENATAAQIKAAELLGEDFTIRTETTTGEKFSHFVEGLNEGYYVVWEELASNENPPAGWAATHHGAPGTPAWRWDNYTSGGQPVANPTGVGTKCIVQIGEDNNEPECNFSNLFRWGYPAGHGGVIQVRKITTAGPSNSEFHVDAYGPFYGATAPNNLDEIEKNGDIYIMNSPTPVNGEFHGTLIMGLVPGHYVIKETNVPGSGWTETSNTCSWVNVPDATTIDMTITGANLGALTVNMPTGTIAGVPVTNMTISNVTVTNATIINATVANSAISGNAITNGPIFGGVITDGALSGMATGTAGDGSAIPPTQINLLLFQENATIVDPLIGEITGGTITEPGFQTDYPAECEITNSWTDPGTTNPGTGPGNGNGFCGYISNLCNNILSGSNMCNNISVTCNNFFGVVNNTTVNNTTIDNSTTIINTGSGSGGSGAGATCMTDTDCNGSGFTGPTFCGKGTSEDFNDLYRVYKQYTCKLPTSTLSTTPIPGEKCENNQCVTSTDSNDTCTPSSCEASNSTTPVVGTCVSSLQDALYQACGDDHVCSAGACLNLIPKITDIDPKNLVKEINVTGDPLDEIALEGTGFTEDSQIHLNGLAVSTEYVSSTELKFEIDREHTPVGRYSVVVVNPLPGGGTSNAVFLSILNPKPSITSFDPTTKAPKSPTFVVTVRGKDFVPESVVKWYGSGSVGVTKNTTYLGQDRLQFTVYTDEIDDQDDYKCFTVYTPGYTGPTTGFGAGGGESGEACIDIVTPGVRTPAPEGGTFGHPGN